MRQRELEAGSHELLHVRSLDIVALLNLGDLEDVDGGESSTVSGSHVLVQGLGSLGTRQSAELLVHVVGAGSRVVSEPDSKVLDLERLLLVDGVHGNNLTGSLLHLSKLTNEVPESRLGDRLVDGKDPHSVQLR